MSPEAGTRDQPIPAGGVAPEGSQGAGKEGPGSARVWRGQGRPGRRRAEQDTQPRRRSSQASPRDGTAWPCGSRGPGLGLGRRSRLRGPRPRTQEAVSSHALPPGLTYTPCKGKANVVFSDYKLGAVPRVPSEAGEASVRSAPGRSAQAPLTFTMNAGGRHVSQLARSDRGSTRSTAWQRGPVLIDAKPQQPRATEAKNQASNEAGVEDSSTDRGQLLGAPSCAVVSVPVAREGSWSQAFTRTHADGCGGRIVDAGAGRRFEHGPSRHRRSQARKPSRPGRVTRPQKSRADAVTGPWTRSSLPRQMEAGPVPRRDCVGRPHPRRRRMAPHKPGPLRRDGK